MNILNASVKGIVNKYLCVESKDKTITLKLYLKEKLDKVEWYLIQGEKSSWKHS